MPTIVETTPRRGRPKKSPIDTLKTQVWFQAVSLMTGKSAYQLEKHFHPEQIRRGEDWIIRPRRWDRYKNGVMVPQDIKGGLIDQVEQEVQGSAAWFRLPLWEAIQHKPLTQDGVNQQLLNLESDVTDILFKPADGMFRERAAFTKELAEQLAALGSLDALAAIFLLVRESEVLGSPEMRVVTLHAYRLIQPDIAACPPFHTLHATLFSYLDSQFPEQLFIHMNQRQNIVIFWDGYRNSCWPKEDAMKSQQAMIKKGKS